MSDALVSPPVFAVTGAVSLVLLGTAIWRVKHPRNDRREPDARDEHIVPLMGVMGAFVFAAQMINFSIPGTGSSGHLVGGILLSAILGPWAALLTLASVLVIQCLVFADGGFMALGANILNMAVLSCLAAYPLLFRPLIKRGASPGRIIAASLLASVVGLELGALAVTIETEASGITALPMGRFLLFMLPIHLFIGIGEGLATAAVICGVQRYKPELLYGIRRERPCGDRALGAVDRRVVLVDRFVRSRRTGVVDRKDGGTVRIGTCVRRPAPQSRRHSGKDGRDTRLQHDICGNRRERSHSAGRIRRLLSVPRRTKAGMKNRLQHVLCALDAMERTARMQSPLHRTDARSKLLVTVVFLVTMLSVPLCRLPELLLFFVFPIVACAMGGLSYGTIFRRSLVVLPFVVFIGVFNLFYDREPVFRIGTLAVTAGWVSFLSIVLRGLLSVQALLVLIGSTGYYGLCRSMQRLGVPAVFTTQLLFVYRYLYVLIEEAAAMQQARDARSFGRRSYPLKIWGTLVGQLLIRTFDRAEQISRAMLARGFSGRIPEGVFERPAWKMRDTLFLAVWCSAFVLLRLCRPAENLSMLINNL